MTRLNKLERSRFRIGSCLRRGAGDRLRLLRRARLPYFGRGSGFSLHLIRKVLVPIYRVRSRIGRCWGLCLNRLVNRQLRGLVPGSGCGCFRGLMRRLSRATEDASPSSPKALSIHESPWIEIDGRGDPGKGSFGDDVPSPVGIIKFPMDEVRIS